MFAAFSASVSADLISEFQSNPSGADPANQDVELSGDAGAAFDLWILTLESDGFNGTVDRATNVTGTYDSAGLAVVSVADLENPSFTMVLVDGFTGAVGDDLDTDDDGVLDVTPWGTVMDLSLIHISEPTRPY